MKREFNIHVLAKSLHAFGSTEEASKARQAFERLSAHRFSAFASPKAEALTFELLAEAQVRLWQMALQVNRFGGMERLDGLVDSKICEMEKKAQAIFEEHVYAPQPSGDVPNLNQADKSGTIACQKCGGNFSTCGGES